MAIFKFTKNKPSALKIWTTLIDTPIHPREGYTEDQIRYRMFIYLQLSSVFKTALSYANKIIDEPSCNLSAMFLPTTCSLAGCTESDFSDLDVLSQSFPHWVSSELYIPYYLTKMLCHKIYDYKLLCSLFNRDHLIPAEAKHIAIDYENTELTAYNLYNSTPMDDMLKYITILYDRTPRPIMSKAEMCLFIRDQLMNSIYSSDNYILPEDTKTTIPYFTLKASDAS